MTVTEERPTAEVGKARLRKEDARLITGQTNWTDNIVVPGMLHLAILRSPFAHARITSLNVEAAKSRPGVIAVFTGKDFAEEQGTIPCAWPVTPDMVNPGHPSLAVDEVKHAGEAVAVVIARDKYAAQDALEHIDIDYDSLPVVLDMEAAVGDGADKVHSHIGGNQSFSFVFDAGDAGTGEPTQDAFDNAEVVVSRRFIQQRLIPAFMEPRSTVVQPVGDGFTMWTSTQVPHILRLMLALTLGVPEHKLRVIAPDVGGGFGGKLQ
ncbi:MAG: xanthine dehydrogenase family protein molybdopterin-binding subunit, partial [Geodermatophilaceae bacterium]|nr:xanthine dehydrogenase family protein molybdopterin-binding subunit [Geodermatophilaceae bacterium]